MLGSRSRLAWEATLQPFEFRSGHSNRCNWDPAGWANPHRKRPVRWCNSRRGGLVPDIMTLTGREVEQAVPIVGRVGLDRAGPACLALRP
jgi:hypothetical protein